jgi:hypothetical protein
MEDFYRYIYFQTLDHTGTPTTSGYTLPITPFTFIPIFDDGISVDYSKQNIMWDFGDGTTSTSITAVHQFKIPGWYNVKCYVLGRGGEGYTDKFSQLILVKDYISDNLILSGLDGSSEAGTSQNPFVVYRFNSWQTYPTLSSEGYKINLNVDGNVANLLNVEELQNDKWAHLKPSSRFETFIYNKSSSLEERTIVNYIYTNNNEIYVKLDRSNNLVFCQKYDLGSCFAGTSGSKIFWYIDDIPKQIDYIAEYSKSIVTATFDTTKFKYDFDKEYPDSEYPILNNISGSSSVKNTIEQLDSDHLTITSNGIDDDNNGNLIDTFNIYHVKFTGQKIPFVVRLKSSKNGKELSSKYNPILKLENNIISLSTSEVYIELRDENNQKINDVEIVSDFGVLSSEKFGGYFKGYLKSDKELKNVHIHARAFPELRERYIVDTTYAFIGHPQSDKVHRLSIQPIKDDVINKQIREDLILTNGLTGIYTSCLTYFRDDSTGETNSFVWLVDSDNDRIIKCNTLTIPNGAYIINLPQNSSPSDICADSNGNVWVSLYDSLSTVRINNISLTIDKVIKPSSYIINEIINGENTISPASIDTDYEDNVYVSYSTQSYSAIQKYDQNGSPISNWALEFNEFNLQLTQIITDLNGNVWGILKDKTTSTSILSAKKDKIVKIDKNKQTTYYNISGSLWNLTTDVNRNIWATKNRNEVVQIDTKNESISSFSLPSNTLNSVNNTTSDLEGIACTTDNTILVIDNGNNVLHYFNGDLEAYGFQNRSINLENVNLPYNRIQNKLNGYGDWNGFKYINKNKKLHIYSKDNLNDICFGKSNIFSIYDSSSGKYHIEKINENIDIKEQIKSYRFQEYLLNKNILFDDFIGTSLGDLNSKREEIGKVIYEKISNFTDNIANIDTCNIEALKSIYNMLDEDFYSFNNYKEMSIPAELKRLVNLFSIKFSKLKGSRNKYNYNFNNRGYNNESIIANGGIPIYGYNKGKELDFLTTVLTAGNHIISFEKFSGEYKFLNTNLLSSSHLNYINPSIKTFNLSSYNQYWGWSLVLPDTYTAYDIPKYYTFFEYVTGYNGLQTEGLINWQSPNTNILENISSVSEWENIKEDMLVYSLAKGLSVIKY